MSRFRLFCGLVATLVVIAPATSFAEDWNAVAAATWNAPDGSANVAAGYSGAQPSGQAATNAAMQQCQTQGGQGCKAYGPWNSGCVYITVGQNATGVAWWANDTAQAVSQACQQAGYTCPPPVGGCVNQ
jgi:hypothetical protein